MATPNWSLQTTRRNPTRRDPLAGIAQKAADDYVADKGYSESSLEAVRRVGKANRRKMTIRIGNYRADI
jgi:hypothetical protein